MKPFDAKRPIPDQILESILDHTDEWEFDKCDAIFWHKPSGLRLWASGVMRNTKIQGPKELANILPSFTLEEKTRISKAVNQLREERNLAKQEEAKKAVVDMLNTSPKPASQAPRGLFGLGIDGGKVLSVLLFLLVWTIWFAR